MSGNFYSGTVLRFLPERGFGFIRCPELQRNVFFHIKEFTRLEIPLGVEPQPGEPVTFTLAPSKTPGKPDSARNVIAPTQQTVGTPLAGLATLQKTEVRQ
jgi:cold shock CspA family protein